MGNIENMKLPSIEKLREQWEPLLKNTNWYLKIVPEIDNIKNTLKKESKEKSDYYKKDLYDFFEYHLIKGDVALGENLKGMDSERRPIDTIVIHHTSMLPGMTPDRLSAIQLIRLYAPYFYNPTYGNDQHLKGQPIYSGHERDGKQVFWPYHWIVRNDGTTERLLEDSEVGWQAGNWDINCRSIAIVLDNDYENLKPSDVEIQSMADIINKNYSQVSKERIFGHREINLTTTCPSNLFLDNNNQKGWKNDLLEKLL